MNQRTDKAFGVSGAGNTTCSSISATAGLRPRASSHNMKRRLRIVLPILIVAAAAATIWYVAGRGPSALRLTGIVTTDAVAVSSEIQGRLQSLLVNQGDTVQAGQLLARIQPQEWKAEMSFYANAEQQSVAQVAQAEADLRYQEAQTTNQIRQAEANLA